MNEVVKVRFASLYKGLFEKWRFKLFHGGRGGGKSWHFGEALLAMGREKTLRVLCVREIQRSIKDSVHKLLSDFIRKHNYVDYVITENSIKNKITGSEFFFRGLLRNEHSIKSIEGVDIVWIEEAQAVSHSSLEYLIPTIRKDGSEVWVSFNRFSDTDPIWVKLCEIARDDVLLKKVNITDLPKSFQSPVLLKEMEYDRVNNYEKYLHTWMGEPLGQDPASIMKRADIVKAMSRTIIGDGAEEVGADIARFGDDRIVFYKRKGLKITKEEIYIKQSITKTANDLMAFAGSKDVKIKIDDTGLGGGVTDILKDRGYSVLPVNFGSSASDKFKDKYSDIISQLWFEFAIEYLPLVQLPNDNELKDELANRLFVYDKEGRRRVESKKDYKKRHGKSPDRADALLLVFFSPPMRVAAVAFGKESVY